MRAVPIGYGDCLLAVVMVFCTAFFSEGRAKLRDWAIWPVKGWLLLSLETATVSVHSLPKSESKSQYPISTEAVTTTSVARL